MSQLLSNAPVVRTYKFDVSQGLQSCVVIKAPRSGVLRRLTIRQLDGTLNGFAAQLYDRETACPDNESGQSYGPGDDEADYAESAHRIGPAISVAGGQAMYESFSLDLPYVNRDSLPPDRTVGFFQIYLSITPGGAEAPNTLIPFELTYTIQS